MFSAYIVDTLIKYFILSNIIEKEQIKVRFQKKKFFFLNNMSALYIQLMRQKYKHIKIVVSSY